uniref:SLC2A4 regulator n=1 Tax=Gallus gallus TaxID=9031 RepID=A0A8V0ZVE5_CHICK
PAERRQNPPTALPGAVPFCPDGALGCVCKMASLHVAPRRCQCPRGSRCRSVSPLQLVGTLEGGGGHGGVAVWGPGRAHHSPCVHAGRKLPGKAGIDEVMAAAVLTSLSSSPLGLWGHCAPVPGSELGSEIWKETPAMSFSCSSSSNTSGEWSWDPPSDRSTPSTPSPPLSSHDPSAFLPTLPPDNGPEEPDSTHFMFGEPIPRKRKNSTKVMFKCLWKSCGKVLSSSSGMQKHIRTAHLGRQADLEQSDGEEDFYYTELDVDVDSLTDGLSSLTPVSPTSSVPPAFPGPELPPFPSPEPPLGSPRSPPPPPGLCELAARHRRPLCPLPHPRRRGDAALPRRKPRGEAKKCRKVYGMENRELWCTACRWKKACQRFLD